jgi:hypothetical protein
MPLTEKDRAWYYEKIRAADSTGAIVTIDEASMGAVQRSVGFKWKEIANGRAYFLLHPVCKAGCADV